LDGYQIITIYIIKKLTIRRLKKYYLESLNLIERLSLLRNVMTTKELKKYLNIPEHFYFDNNKRINYVSGIVGAEIIDNLYTISKYEIQNYLLNTLLRDTDVVGMGNGIEIRPPLLDHILVEHAVSLPDKVKWKNGIGKAILKDAAKDLLPDDFFNRPKKGFDLPTTNWLVTEMRERFFNTINSDCSRLFFTRSLISNLEKNVDNPRNNKLAFPVFVFLEWAKHNNINSLNE